MMIRSDLVTLLTGYTLMRSFNKDRVALLTGNTRMHNFNKDWVTLLTFTVTQMAQTPMLRAEAYARGLRASQNVERAEVWVSARCA
jgi:hypothetical protein